MKNPPAALAALCAPGSVRVGRFEVRELTLGHLAVLEQIGSPLADRSAKRSLAAWAETLYALTRGAAECFALLASGRDAFREAAMRWAEGVRTDEALAMIRAVGASGGRLSAVLPPAASGEDAEADPTDAGRTAGSPTPPPAPASASAGL